MKDINEIKNNIKKILNDYNLCCLSVCTKYSLPDKETYVLNLESKETSNDKYNSLSVDELNNKIDYINYIRESYNQMTTLERKMIYWTYLDKEHNFDDRYIADNLGWSLGYYYIKKKETLIRFAYSLRIER